MKPYSEFLKAYDGDEVTAERVFKKFQRYENKPLRRVHFKTSLFGVNYSVYVMIPETFKLTRYVGEYATLSYLLEVGKLKQYRKSEYHRDNGKPNFYNKLELEQLKNIEVF